MFLKPWNLIIDATTVASSVHWVSPSHIVSSFPPCFWRDHPCVQTRTKISSMMMAYDIRFINLDVSWIEMKRHAILPLSSETFIEVAPHHFDSSPPTPIRNISIPWWDLIYIQWTTLLSRLFFAEDFKYLFVGRKSLSNHSTNYSLWMFCTRTSFL